MREEAVLLGPGQTNVGVLTTAVEGGEVRSNIAAICITAGLLHHVGPHRMPVLLARALTEKGISSLRIDLSGIGDSAVRVDDLPVAEIPVQEINDAIIELETRGFNQFILFGICSGAVHAIKVATGNPKIAGIILINNGTDDGDIDVNSEIGAHFYFKRSIWSLNAWKNLFTGKVKYRLLIFTLISALMNKLKGDSKNSRSFEEKIQSEVQLFIDQGTSILVVLSDRHAQLYQMLRQTFDNLEGAHFKTLVYAETDHLFTSLSMQRDLIDRICQWSGDLVNKNTRNNV